jgi:hypothetical protein
MSVQTSSHKKTSLSQSPYCRWYERYMKHASDDGWDVFLLMDSNLLEVNTLL